MTFHVQCLPSKIKSNQEAVSQNGNNLTFNISFSFQICLSCHKPWYHHGVSTVTRWEWHIFKTVRPTAGNQPTFPQFQALSYFKHSYWSVNIPKGATNNLQVTKPNQIIYAPMFQQHQPPLINEYNELLPPKGDREVEDEDMETSGETGIYDIDNLSSQLTWRSACAHKLIHCVHMIQERVSTKQLLSFFIEEENHYETMKNNN